MLNSIKRLFSRGIRDAQGAAVDSDRNSEGQPWNLRRWESAQTTRLNSAHWSGAFDTSINENLSLRLPTLRARSQYEVANNPMLEGMIEGYVNDLFGKNGPSLQMQSENADYNEAFEKGFRQWWKRAGFNGEHGADILKSCGWLLWMAGEYLIQLTGDETARDGPQLRLRSIHPRRLGSPLDANDRIFMGLELTETGRVIRFHILKEDVRLGSWISAGETEPYDADSIIHEFDKREPDQVRGVPWLASALDPIGELRDYDAQTLDAARASADQAHYLYNTTQNGKGITLPAGDTMPIQRRQLRTLPNGWQPWSSTPPQPSANYVEYRKERQRDIGRARGLPLMVIRLDASGHNYSSARFDGQTYNRGIGCQRAKIERTTLSRIVAAFKREFDLSWGRIAPATTKLVWHWDEFPHVDPSKEATAERIEIENGTLTYTEALARKSKDLETVIAERKREKELLEAAGLPPLPIAKSSVVLLQSEMQAEADEKEEAEEKAAAKAGDKSKARVMAV